MQCRANGQRDGREGECPIVEIGYERLNRLCREFYKKKGKPACNAGLMDKGRRNTGGNRTLINSQNLVHYFFDGSVAVVE